MSAIGQPKNELLGAVAVALGAAVAMFAMRGFVVDDAWIPVRYARHLADGFGYRFNIDGAVSDGVTPLPYAVVLSAVARGASAEVVLERARWLGALAWLGAAFALGHAIMMTAARASDRMIAGIAVAVSVPIAAHAVTGLETPLATAAVTLAACSFAQPWRVAILGGFAAMLRPELVPWAVTASFGASLVTRRRERAVADAIPRSVAMAALALAPFAATVVVRMAIFGRPLPLSVMAKPSDLAHGFTYACAAVLAAITPVLAFAPLALRRAGGRGVVLALAGVAHVFAMIAVGGDWMPYARLVVPIAPSLVLVSLDAARGSSTAARAARALAAGGLAAYLLVFAAPEGRHIASDRRALAHSAKPLLAQAKSIAALDIGWPSSIFEGTIVDLAGLTDASIAVLPGGHTSKRVDPSMLFDRNPDVLLFYAKAHSIDDAVYVRAVEARLAGADLVRSRYEPRAFLPLGATGFGYVAWTRH